MELIIPPNRFTLPLWRKTSFGMGGFGVGVVRSVIGLFQLAFLLEVVQMTPAWGGITLFLEQIIDAFVDAIIGILSDNLPTRYGRRKPWVYVMCVPTLVFWILSWVSPGSILSQSEGQFIYYLFIYSIFSFCFACVIVPYQAIIPDIAPTPLERSVIVVIWQFFTVIGATCAAFIWSSSIVWFPVEAGNIYDQGMPENYRKGYAVASVITGIPFLLTILLGVSSVMDRREPMQFESLRVVYRQTCRVLSFRPFQIICIIRCASMLSLAQFLSSLILYLKYVIGTEERNNWLILSMQMTVAVSLFAWLFASTRISKAVLFNVGSLVTCVAFILFFFAEGSWIPYLFIIFIFRGTSSSAAYLFPQSMVPDVIEYYYTRYQDRREATFYSLINALEKTAIGVGFILSGVMLEYSGYQSPHEQAGIPNFQQPPATLLCLRLLVSFIPLFFTLIACFAALWYTISVDRSGRYKNSDELFSDFDATDFSDSDLKGRLR